MSDIKITIITVVYNAVEWIEETILSVIHQTYDNIEYLIIDGGSTDGTLEVIHRYQHAISGWISEPDRGVYDAMNKGAQLSSGSWIHFLNAGDCFVTRDVLKEVAQQMEESVSFLYGDSWIDDGSSLHLVHAKKLTKFGLLFWGTRALCHQSAFIKRKKFIFYDTRYRLKAELNWYFDILAQGLPVRKIAVPICTYRLGGLSDRLFFLEMTETLQVMWRQKKMLIFMHMPIYIYKLIKRIMK